MGHPKRNLQQIQSPNVRNMGTSTQNAEGCPVRRVQAEQSQFRAFFAGLLFSFARWKGRSVRVLLEGVRKVCRETSCRAPIQNQPNNSVAIWTLHHNRLSERRRRGQAKKFQLAILLARPSQ